jgi:hypothetical protein
VQLIRRFSAAAVMAEQLEAALARGEAINISEHALLVSTMVRVAARISIDRRARDVTTLDEYLASRSPQSPANDDELAM